ncbi:hypothetical protein ACTA71_004429 [Dictyostelium dimigraforme]
MELKILKLLIFLVFIYLAYSQFLEQTEVDCLSSIAKKYNPSGWSKDESGNYTFCNYNGIICDFTGRVSRLQISGIGGNANKLSVQDLTCVPYIQDLQIKFLDIDPELIYYKFNNCKTVTYYSTNGPQEINRSLPPYDEFTSYALNLNNSIIKTSYICNVKKLSISGNGYVNFLNDGVDSCINGYQLEQILIWANNYPDYSVFNNTLQSITMSFGFGFDKNSIGNFSKIYSANVEINHAITLETTPFYASDNFNIKSLKMIGSFEKPSSIFDLRRNTNYKKIDLMVYGFQFNVDGKLPIIVGNNVDFSFSNGNITSLPSLQTFGDTFHRVTINKSISISTVLPIYDGIGLSYDLSSNRFTGTIDTSWCKTEVNFYLNSLSGPIPSCFSCYFNSTSTSGGNLPTMYNRFTGNQFTTQQLNRFIPCTTFRPVVKVLNKTAIIVQGIDIGFDSSNWLVNGSIGFQQTTPIKVGSEYHCSLSSGSFIGVDYFSVLFTLPNNNLYTFAVNPKKEPNPNYVLLETSTLKIKGTFFSSYMNYTNQNVTIGSTQSPCTIKSGDFFSIECDIQTVITPGKTTLTIGTGTLRRKVAVDLQNGLVNNKTCPNDCTSDANGECDLSTGFCTCTSGFVYSDCSGIDCGFYCINGACNFSNGTCICSEGYTGHNCNTSIIHCPTTDSVECSGNGFCDYNIGKCLCDGGYQGSACSIPILACPTGSNLQICSGFGICNPINGECVCDEGRTSSDCSGFQCTPIDCFSHGICDFTIGNCTCLDKQWLGINCSIPYQYITSISASTIDGGLAIVYGLFGDVHNGLSIKLDNVDCNITNYSSDEISFMAPPGTDKTLLLLLSLFQNGITIYKEYRYENKIQLCPNNCSRNGICNSTNGQCNCNNGFSGFDCGIRSINGNDNPTNTTIDPTTGGTIITNHEINFNIYFKSIFEIDYNSKIVKEYPLKNNWKINSNSNQKYQLVQSIQDMGTCTITSIIEEITNSNGKEFTFADTTFTLEKASIKFTISINNYTYQNNLNTLQLQLVSLIDNSDVDDDDNGENQSNCNRNQTEIETYNQDGKLNFNYIKISKDNRILVGRFINKLVSNGRSTFLSTTITNDTQSSVIVSLNLPHCKDCLIDPDFSLVITSDFKLNCGDNNTSKSNWVIPIAVVVSVAGAAIIAGALLFFYRKKFVDGKLQKQLKQFKMSKQKTNK